MDFKNKVITVILIVSLCFSSVLTAFAEGSVNSEEIKYDANFTEEAKLLEMIGIENLPSSKVWDSVPITKGKFLELALQLSYYDPECYYEAILPYEDVTEEVDGYNAFVYAYLNDILYDDVKMYPNDSLTRYFAVQVIRGILGYNVKVHGELVYNKPNLEKQILEGVSFGEYDTISTNGAVKLLYNALGIEVMQMNTIGISGSDYIVGYDVQDEFTLLAQLKDIYRIGGRVQATPVASIIGKCADPGKVIIDNVSYTSTDVNCYLLIGAEVSGYYKKTEDGDREIMLLKKSDSIDEIVIDAEDIGELTPSKICYYKDGNKERTLSLNNPIIIYNGHELKSGEFSKYGDKIFDIEQGNVTLYGGNSGYDVMIVRSFSNLIVASKDADNYKVYDMNDKTKSVIIDKDSYDLYAVNDANGQELEFDKIAANGVITYARSLDEKVIEAVYGGTVLTTSVQGMTTSGNQKVITISDKDYPVLKSVTKQIKLNVVYNIYINDAGYVCGIDDSSSVEGQLGYLMGAAQEGVFSTNLQIKLLASTAVDEDDALILKCSEKLIVDGIKCKDAAEAETAIKKFNGTDQIPVIYKLSAEGVVTSLDTPYYDSSKESGTSLRCRHTKTDSALKSKSMDYWGYRNLYDGKYYLSYGGMCILNLPDGSIFIADQTRNDKSYNIDLYSLGDETYIMCFAVVDDSSGSSDFVKQLAIVEDVVQTLNSKDERTVRITTRNGSAVSELYVAEGYANSDAVKNIDVGDVLRYKIDGRNEITEIETLLDYSDKDGSVGYMNQTVAESGDFRVAVGKVYSVEDDPNCKTSYGKIISYFTDPDDILGSMETLFIRTGSCGVFSAFRDNLIFTDSIDFSQILTYKDVGDAADIVLTTSQYLVPTNTYIVK